MRFRHASSALLLPDRELEVPRRLRPLSMAAPQQALLGGGSGGSTFALVSLLMHMEGGTLVDSSSNAHALTASGATQDTGWSKFGTKSLLVSTTGGNQNRVTAADHAAFDMGTDEFTIEFALRVATLQLAIILTKATGTGNSPFHVRLDSANKILFRVTNQAGGLVDITSTTTIAANTDYWVTCRRRNNVAGGNMVTELAINGSIEATSPTQLLTFDLFDNTGPLVIGNYNSGATFPLLARVDELRISRMLQSVSVPGAAFPDS
jgi:hypothetical protein